MNIVHYEPPWFEWLEIKKLIAAYEAENIPFCFHGGAIRDGVLGVVPMDFDIIAASSLDKNISLLKKANITIQRIYKEDKKIKAIIGRHYMDIYCSDKNNDTNLEFLQTVRTIYCHNDFTINLLYLTPAGDLCDDYNGMDDIKTGNIRFNPQVNITQQYSTKYLHVLRFFRFCAQYGRQVADCDKIMELCAKNIEFLSQERDGFIHTQLFKLLTAPGALPTLELMRKYGIIEHVFKFPIDTCDGIAAMQAVEKCTGTSPDHCLRLASLLLGSGLGSPETLSILAQAWCLPPNVQQRIEHFFIHINQVTQLPIAPSIRHELLGLMGREDFKKLLLLGWAMQPDSMTASDNYRPLLESLN